MPTIFSADAGDHLCPYNDFKPCFGVKCMAWSWHGPTADHCETDNLVDTEEGPRPIGDPKLPVGEGWEMDGAPRQKSYHRSQKDKLPPALSQRWVKHRERQEGSCDRSGRDREYGW